MKGPTLELSPQFRNVLSIVDTLYSASSIRGASSYLQQVPTQAPEAEVSERFDRDFTRRKLCSA
jgi:membrane-bound lytic murein transglycosylase MltF